MYMNQAELAEFYSANFDKLVKQASNRCGNFHDGEDIVQTAFERAVKYAHSCDGDVGRWFSGILRNCLKAHLNMVRLGPVTKPLEEHFDDIEPVIPDDIRNYVKFEVSEMVRAESEPRKTVLRLHLDFGLTNGEIVELVGGMTYRKVNNIIQAFRQRVLKRYK